MWLSTQSLIGSINTKDAVIVKNVILHISTQVIVSISLFVYTILVNTTIKNMRYANDKDFVWDGYLIRLDLFNNDVMGAKLQEVEGYSFEDMPYFQNAYDFEPDDFEAGYLSYIDSWLAYNDYGYRVNDNKYTREITKEQVIEIINEHIKNCLVDIK